MYRYISIYICIYIYKYMTNVICTICICVCTYSCLVSAYVLLSCWRRTLHQCFFRSSWSWASPDSPVRSIRFSKSLDLLTIIVYNTYFLSFFAYFLLNALYWVGFESILRSWLHYRNVNFIDSLTFWLFLEIYAIYIYINYIALLLPLLEVNS